MHTIRLHLTEAKYEFIRLLRAPQFALPTLGFPLIFYIFFAMAMGGRMAGPVRAATYMLATYGCFGVMGASLFGFGVSIAMERGLGWLQVKRTTPMPLSAYFFAKMVMALLFSCIIVLSLFALAFTLAHVRLPFGTAAALFATLVAGSVTFSALGLAIGYFASAQSAAPIVNLIYLPLSFLSGLWSPIWALPRPVQMLAVFLPPYHFSQLALHIVNASRGGSVAGHITALVIATALFLGVAVIGFRRDEATQN